MAVGCSPRLAVSFFFVLTFQRGPNDEVHLLGPYGVVLEVCTAYIVEPMGRVVGVGGQAPETRLKIIDCRNKIEL